LQGDFLSGVSEPLSLVLASPRRPRYVPPSLPPGGGRNTGGTVVSQKRKARPAPPPAEAPREPEAPTDGAAPETKSPGMGLIWRVLGGATVAAVVFLGVAICQQVQAQLSELRSDLGALNKETRRELASLGERHGGLTKRADHDSRVRLIWDSLKELRNDR